MASLRELSILTQHKIYMKQLLTLFLNFYYKDWIGYAFTYLYMLYLTFCILPRANFNPTYLNWQANIDINPISESLLYKYTMQFINFGDKLPSSQLLACPQSF